MHNMLTIEEIEDMKAAAVMEFVNVQIDAFEAGFVDTNTVSLFSLYRFAQHHVKDNYGTETKLITEQWGDHIAEITRSATDK